MKIDYSGDHRSKMLRMGIIKYPWIRMMKRKPLNTQLQDYAIRKEECQINISKDSKKSV